MDCPTGKSAITTYELAEKARKRSNKKHGKPMSTYRTTSLSSCPLVDCL